MADLTLAGAIDLLDVQPARVAAFVARDGKKRDEDGGVIDDRQTEPWVWALGPFGSWPCTVAEATATLRQHTTFATAESIRIGRVVLFKDEWGFAAKSIPLSVVYPALADILTQPLTPELLAPLDGGGGWRLLVRRDGLLWRASAGHSNREEVIVGNGPTIGEAVDALAAKLRGMAGKATDRGHADVD